ncbi:uncharacterized protein DNG_09739 [Cephalotrichum gorgonifer]|uniref:Uncharacterized protein n=1 Tax=Cephalotrichum gorgonifer TaxID=2041049 RepID=A0AAE8N8S5_9PEZI|nr:uncharacterized protein DNG_09739 [Cephalotrichum gorgonifer]
MLAAQMDESSQSSSPFISKMKRPAPPMSWQSWRGALTEAARQSWKDILAARWRQFILFGFYMFWLSMLLGQLVIMGFNTTSGSGSLGDDGDQGCQPDGQFSLYKNSFDWWAPRAFFEISLSAGAFSFANVKVIDIAAQVVVGRGGQALLAFISWCVFAKYLTAKMTESPITYATFWVIFLHQEPTLVSTYRLMRDFLFRRGPGSITAAAFMLFTVVFLLVFPTFVNSMTGYKTTNEPYVKGFDQNMILLDKLDKVAYIVHDGHRINQTDDYILRSYEGPMITTLSSGIARSDCSRSTPPKECDATRDISEYTKKYGFYGLLDEETEFNGITLPAPALNVSAFYLTGSTFYGEQYTDPRTGQQPFRDINRMQYVSSNELYSLEHVSSQGSCQPSSDTYQWGASFPQLFVMLVALSLWSIGIFAMWYKAHRRLPLAEDLKVPSGWRGVLELSRAMEAELTDAGIDLAATSDRQAKREIQKRLRGGAVSFEDYYLSKKDYRFRLEFIAWLKKERWWLGASVGCFAVAFGIWAPTGIAIPAIIFWVLGGVVLAVLWYIKSPIMTFKFNLPINLSRLENDRLKLVPLEDNLEAWAEAYVQDANRNPHVYDWLTYGPFADGADYVSWYNETSRDNASELLLAIVLKAGTVTREDPSTGEVTTTEVTDGTFAGLCGLSSQPERATTDIGQLLVSSFQRTFVVAGECK